MKQAKLVIENKFEKVMTVFIERHADYYWLMPGEVLEVQMEGSAGRPGYFDVQQIEEGLVIHPSAGPRRIEVVPPR